jgi:PAS domain S-box-containing protein
MLNKLLQRQINKYLGETDSLPQNYQALFNAISESYDHFEKDRKMLERSVELSSKEMIELNNLLRKDIVKLEKNEREIKENEANLYAIINNTEDSIFSIDKNYKILSINNSLIRKVEKYAGRSMKSGDYIFLKEFGEERSTIWKQCFDKALNGEQFKIEIKESVNGELIYAELSFNPIKEKDEIIGVGCFSRNVTNERLSEERLKASEIRFRSIIENSQDMISLLNEKGEMEYISPAIDHIYGYIKGINYREIIHPDDLAIAEGQFHLALKNPGVPIPATLRNKRKDGVSFWVEGTLTNMLDVKGINAMVGNYRDVTEKKNAKEKFQKSEANLQTIFNNADTAYILIDKDLKIIFLNQHAQKFSEKELKCSIQEGMDVLKCFPLSMQQSIKDVLLSVLKGNKVGYEMSYSQSDGSNKWYDIKYFPVSNKDEGVFGAIISYTDFTERKLSEEKLKYTEHLLSEAQQLAKVGSWNVDLIKNEIIWSSGTRITYGVDDNFEPSFDSFLSMIHPEDKERVATQIVRARQTGESVDYEFRIIRKDGQIRILNGQTRYTLNEEGNPIRIYGISHDITELKLTEETLRRSEANLRAIFDNTETSYILLDTEFRIQSFNPIADLWAKSTLNISFQESDVWWNYFPEQLLNDLKEKGTAVLNGNTIKEEMKFLKTDNSLLYYETIANPVLNNQGKVLGICIALNDITKRKMAELEREKMITDIIQRNKNLEQFSYIVSHNLRAPVANIMGLSLALQEDNLEKTLADVLLDGLNASAIKLDETIMDLSDILQIKREINERKELVSFTKLSNDISISLKNQLENSNTTIKCDFSEIDSMLTIKSYLYSVFYNLIFNSVKYRQQNVPPVIEMKSRKVKNKIELIFKDNCMGIDLEKNSEHIFGLYKRFHNSEVEGKGLGLFMVKTQIESMGGKISIYSEVNKGTEFKIEFED